jgi:hypothetical protein
MPNTLHTSVILASLLNSIKIPDINEGSLESKDVISIDGKTACNSMDKVTGKKAIHMVIMLSADRHRSDVRRITREKGYDLYDFMSSVLTNYHTHKIIETPELIFGYNEDNSFGMIHFDTRTDDPKMTFEIVTIDDKSVWSMDLKLSQLKN